MDTPSSVVFFQAECLALPAASDYTVLCNVLYSRVQQIFIGWYIVNPLENTTDIATTTGLSCLLILRNCPSTCQRRHLYPLGLRWWYVSRV